MKKKLKKELKTIADLSVRALNIYNNNFESIEDLLVYYNTNKNFISLKNSGHKTNIEFIKLSKYLLKNINSFQIDKNINDSENIHTFQDIQLLYQKLKQDSSLKVKKILYQIEEDFNKDINSLIKAIISGNILNKIIKTCSEISKKEIQDIFNQLKTQSSSNDIYIIKTQYSILNKSDIETLAELYLILKNNLSVRARNILSTIDKKNNTEINYILKSIMLSEIDFQFIPNCGVKTKNEIHNLSNQLRAFYLNNKSNPIESEKQWAIHLKISRLFPTIPSEVINQVAINDDTFDIAILLAAAIYFNEFRDSKKGIIQELFKLENTIKFKKTPNKFNLSKERIRQIIKELYEKDIENLHDKIVQNLSTFKISIFENNSYYILKISDISFKYLDNIYIPNNILLNRIYNIILREKYYSCLAVYNSINSDYKLLNKQTISHYFIEKKINNTISFGLFIQWIEEQIYAFEKYDIKFDMDILIRRYLIKYPNIDDFLIMQLSKFISEHKSDCSETVFQKKGKKEFELIQTVSLCFSFIEQMNKPVKTIDLLKYLFKSGIQIKKYQLLRLLKNSRDKFSSFGHGMWALSTWRLDGLIGGSLRDIVLTLLNNSESPLHVSSILNYLTQFRAVSYNSLIKNLKSANNRSFIFFNCNFIGSYSKKYDSYWYNLPKINGRHFGQDMLNTARKENPNISEYYFLKYKYPKINTEFLLKIKEDI